MAPRPKSKKKAAPNANGDNTSNDSPVTVKKPARGRKANAEPKNAEAEVQNENSEQVVAVKDNKQATKAKPTESTASTSKNSSSGPSKAKATKNAVAVAVKKTKAAVKENEIVEEPAEPKQENAEENILPAPNGKAHPQVTKKAALPKAAGKLRGKPAVKNNNIVETSSVESAEANIVPSSGKGKPKAPKKAAEPKAVAKPRAKATAKIDIAKLTAPPHKIESPQPSTSTVALVEVVPVAPTKGRKKRENVEAIESIDASLNIKRDKKPTVISTKNDAIDVKVNATKRTAFSKKAKNVSEENSSAIEENIPVDSAISKRKKSQPKPIAVAEKRTTIKRKAAEKPPVKDQSESEEEEVTPKKSRKPATAAKTKTKKAKDADKPKLNATSTDFSKINFASDKEFNMKICSFNVSGLRAFVAKGGHNYFDHEQPNIICLQEIKCLQDEVPDAAKIKNYHPYWFSKPGGRAGVAILSKNLAHNVEYGLGDEDMDDEGRIITAEYEKFYLICVYVPNAGRKLVTLPRRLRWNKLFEQHVAKLNEKKPVIICGDMNVAHTEIDLANPKTNTKNAGFTPQEREGLTDLLALGFTDAFRYLYPSVQKAYTFWSYMGNARSKNIGWRLDYFITSDRLNPSIVDCFMRSEVLGSDHCPINLLLNI